MADYKDSVIYKEAEKGNADAMHVVGVSLAMGADDFPKR